MKTIECFEVCRWDGGERHNFAFYLSDKGEAEAYRAANKIDTVRPVVLVVFDTLAEVQESERGKLRKQALAKLSPLEREALGFSRTGEA